MPLTPAPMLLTVAQLNGLNQSARFKNLAVKFYAGKIGYLPEITPEDIEELRRLIEVLNIDVPNRKILIGNDKQAVHDINATFKGLELVFQRLAISYAVTLVYVKNYEQLRDNLRLLTKKVSSSRSQTLSSVYAMAIKKLEEIDEIDLSKVNANELAGRLEHFTYVVNNPDSIINLDYCLAKHQIENIELALELASLHAELKEITENLYRNKPKISGPQIPSAPPISNEDKVQASTRLYNLLRRLQAKIDEHFDSKGTAGKILSEYQKIYRLTFTMWYRLNFQTVQQPQKPYVATEEEVGVQLANIQNEYYKAAREHAILLMEHQIYGGEDDLYKKMEKKYMQLLDQYACALCEIIVNVSELDYGYIENYLKNTSIHQDMDETIREYKDRKPIWAPKWKAEAFGTNTHAINTNPLAFFQQVHSVLCGLIQLLDPLKTKSMDDYNKFADLTEHLPGTKEYLDKIPKDYTLNPPSNVFKP